MAVAKFRSRARVIDLLGRQQIADVPTAVGELFKNALDAGARNAWVDLWKDEDKSVLVLRDDGLGMRTDDVLNKWLILATESKHIKQTDDDSWIKYADDEQRKWLKQPSYGEKGIGRLSVATLGRMTLLWSVWGEGVDKRGTLCLVHWHLFQHPTKLFEDLPIPYMKLTKAPSEKDIEDLFEELRTNKVVKAMLSDDKWNKRLRDDLEKDLNLRLKTLLQFVEFPWKAGTMFCILGVSDEVNELFLETTNDKTDPLADFHPDWLKSYHAFSTFWDPFHNHTNRNFNIFPCLSGEKLKRIHRYWEPEDFGVCDHHIRIEVSEDGFAKGFIKNYETEALMYERQLKSLPKGCDKPGAFLVEIGYVQGEKADTFLSEDLHREINKRLTHAGGFSIYLNNVRVQPYGSIDSDFAGFEERRLKNAGRYYFSTRRMFGGIFIPSKEKTKLEEKAGREGFVVNGARKGLRFWVEDIFIDIADRFLGRKAEREDKRRRQEAKKATEAKARLEREKKEYIESIRLAKGWLKNFENDLRQQILKSYGLLASASNGFLEVMVPECKKEIDTLYRMQEELRRTPSLPPAGVVIEGDGLKSIEDYISKRENLILVLNKEIESETKDYQKLVVRIKQKEKHERDIAARIAYADGKIRDGVRLLLQPAIEKARYLEAELIEFESREIRELVAVREREMENVSVRDIVEDETGDLAGKLEFAIQIQQNVFEKEVAPRLLQLKSDILHLTDKTSGSLVLSEQTKELQALKERHAFLVEVAQLGLVFETANHEHEKQVACVRDSIKLLRSKLDAEGQQLIQALSDSFDIVDERIRLFDPLVRRRTSIQENITGFEIEEFLRKRFNEYFEVNNLVQVTKNFQETSWNNVKRPVFLGAIHNVFHNALYWSQKGRASAHVRLSASGELLIISDSGPGINAIDIDYIFEPGFSRRPYGRGLGLYIAREALRGIGFDLFCPSEPELGALEGANFIIASRNYTDENN